MSRAVTLVLMNSLRVGRGACVLFLLWSCQVLLLAQDHIWSKHRRDSAIARWPGGRITRGDEKLSDWAYDKSVLFAGLIAVWQNTGDKRYLNYVQQAMEAFVGPDGKIASYKVNELSLDELALGRQLLFL